MNITIAALLAGAFFFGVAAGSLTVLFLFIRAERYPQNKK